MRATPAILLLALFSFVTLPARSATLTATPDPTLTTAPTPAPASDALYPLVLAAGALAGVATVNVLTYGLGTLPLVIGVETAAPIISPAAAAASRIFVITSGVLGAWIADALYAK